MQLDADAFMRFATLVISISTLVLALKRGVRSSHIILIAMWSLHLTIYYTFVFLCNDLLILSGCSDILMPWSIGLRFHEAITAFVAIWIATRSNDK